MGAPSEFCSFTFHFHGLPKHVTITKSTGCLNDDDVNLNLIEVPVSTELFSNRLLTFPQVPSHICSVQAPSCSVSLPSIFFDGNSDVYEKNVKRFLTFLESYLLSQSGLNISESTDDLSAKPLPHGSEDKNGSGSESGQKDELVPSHRSVLGAKTLRSLEKGDPKVAKGQNQQANIDVNEPIDLSLQQSQYHTVSTKPQTTVLSQQQGSCSGPSNLSVNQKSKVSSESAQSDVQYTSSGVLHEQTGAHVEDSEMVTPFPTISEVELTVEKKHTVHCFLHRSEVKCETLEECQKYDEEFASRFEQFLDRSRDVNTSQPSVNNEDTSGDYFLKYIEAHLQTKKCPSPCTRLWKYCLDNRLFYLFKYAPEGLLIHSSSSSRQDAAGTVIDTYFGYRNVDLKIGSGGFGKVYKFSDNRAIKEEFKQPLITGNAMLFQQILKLNHPHVISVLEYIAGPDNDENKCFLSVMPFKNQKDLQKQFTKEKHLTCVLEYMTVFPDQKRFIFRNYTVLFRHVFDGLCYLKNQRIVHRDIKPSNILVHQKCECQSPLQCTCPVDGDVTYLLGDMDLLSLEESKNLTYTCDEWEKMAGHDPVGTIGMKPPEAYRHH